LRRAVEGGGDQSEHEIDMQKIQIHSLRADNTVTAHTNSTQQQHSTAQL